MESRIAQSAADRRFAMFALTLFGGIALLLAGVGIYGVVSYAVETRRSEIGVRMALGATSWAMIRELLREAATIALGGIVIGSAAGYFASLALQHSLYGVSRLDPTAYAVGAGVLLITALAGAFVPARRTSRIDPMVAMRGE
jgi:ABC-type antimicrobial peptide transport system permease subunit